MLSNKIKTISGYFIAIVLVLLTLLIGFRIGYGFILDQDAKASAIASASRQAELEGNNPGESNSESTDENSRNEKKVKTPVHVTKDTPGAIEIYINYGDGSRDVAKQLVEKGIIDNALPFVVVGKINGFDGKFQKGTHFVLEGMNYNEIMYNLSLPAESSWITFPEGTAYIEMKKLLRENGVNFDEKKMDNLVNSPELFTKYSFISAIPTDRPERVYALEGYLFPDTYQFDLNATEEDIINTMLRNTERKLTKDITERASSLGLSLDRLLTLASIIEAESGNPYDQYKISRVFHNRLYYDWNLESDATINYLLKLEGKETVWAADEEQLEIDNPYNTYKNEGLPPGPISNPGLNAIKAALYPDTDDQGIMFFVADGEGGTVFASTQAEHQANIEKYRGNWK